MKNIYHNLSKRGITGRLILAIALVLTLAAGLAMPPGANASPDNGEGNLNFTGNYSILWQESLEADEAPGAAGAYIVPDMDGDSKPDVLVRTTKYNSSTSTRTAKVVARKGTDGTQLWEELVSATGEYSCDILPFAAGDLNGDELGDVILVQYEPDMETFETTWQVTAKEGIDGTDLWQESLVTDYMGAFPATDLNGDGLDDVVVFHWESSLATATATAKKGIDGSDLWNESISAPQCIIEPVPMMGDIDGDGLSDVVVWQWEYNPVTDIQTAKVIAKKGTDGSDLWEESISASYCQMWASGAGDPDGNGLCDVVVWQYEYDNSTNRGTAKVIVKRGIDGTQLWEEPVIASGKNNCYMSAFCPGDLDGYGLGDIIVMERKYDELADTWTEKVIVKRGIDGTQLWEEPVIASGKNNCSIAPTAGGDLDGDGLIDVAVEQWEYNPATGTTTAKVIAKKGIDGTHLWEESKTTTGKRTCDMAAFFAGDLDGNGLGDVIVRQRECTPSPEITTASLVIAKKGIDGTQSWQAEADRWVWVDTGAGDSDLNGDGKDDVLVGTSSEMYAVSTGPTGEWDPWNYDTSPTDGHIEIGELLSAISDYIDGKMTINNLLDVISLYINPHP